MGKAQVDELLAHAGWVRALARRLVADQATADDLTQETWLRVLQQPPRDDRNTPGWLARITRNARHRQWQSEVRRRKREAEAADELGGASVAPDELVAEAEVQQQIGRNVLRLQEPYRTVILRHYWRGESAAEIGAATGVSAATVRSQLARARASLHDALERDIDGGHEAVTRTLLVAAGPSLRLHAASTQVGGTSSALQHLTPWLQGAALMKTPRSF